MCVCVCVCVQTPQSVQYLCTSYDMCSITFFLFIWCVFGNTTLFLRLIHSSTHTHAHTHTQLIHSHTYFLSYTHTHTVVSDSPGRLCSGVCERTLWTGLSGAVRMCIDVSRCVCVRLGEHA